MLRLEKQNTKHSETNFNRIISIYIVATYSIFSAEHKFIIIV